MATLRDTRLDEVPITPAAHGHSANASAVARPRTLIVSDVRLYRDGLALALESRGDIQLVGTADSLENARVILAGTPCDVVLLDACMPAALGTGRTLMLENDGTKVVAVAVAEVPAEIVACARSGLHGYVARNASIADVATAVHAAVRNEVNLPPAVAAEFFKALAELGPVVDAEVLTNRELEIVGLIDRGLSNKQIAQKLRIGTATVKNHVHNILEKLKLSRRAEAAAHMRGKRIVASGMSGERRGETNTPAERA